MPNRKDIKLLKALKVNLEGAYKSLYQNYFTMVRHFVLNNTGSEEDVKDVFQETAVALFELIHKPQFKLQSALSTIIYSIARNIWLKQLRQQGVKVNVKDFESFTVIEEDDYDVEQERIIDTMERAIKNLGEPCKGILQMFYYQKKSMQAIAKVYNYKTSDHAKAQKYKCIKRLRASI